MDSQSGEPLVKLRLLLIRKICHGVVLTSKTVNSDSGPENDNKNFEAKCIICALIYGGLAESSMSVFSCRWKVVRCLNNPDVIIKILAHTKFFGKYKGTSACGRASPQ